MSPIKVSLLRGAKSKTLYALGPLHLKSIRLLIPLNPVISLSISKAPWVYLFIKVLGTHPAQIPQLSGIITIWGPC